MADTGCQSCLCKLKIYNKLGILEKNLTPVTLRMIVASEQPMSRLSAATARLFSQIWWKVKKHIYRVYH